MISFSLSCPDSLTCRCRLSAHTPGQVFPLSWAGEPEEAAAAFLGGSCRNMSEMCTTSAEGPGTSSAAGCWLSSGWTRLTPVRDTSWDGQLGLLWLLLIKKWRSGNVHNLWGPTLNALPLADRLWHHLPVWTGWLKEPCKGRLSNSWYLKRT